MFVPEHYFLAVLLQARSRLSRYWCGVRSASGSRAAAEELLRGLTEHIAGTNSNASCTTCEAIAETTCGSMSLFTELGIYMH